MPRKGNLPTERQPEVQPGELSLMVSDFDELRRQTYPKSDEEVETRIQWFFDWCVRHDRRPGIELLALALSTTRQNLWLWEQRGDRKGRAITQAKQLILTCYEQWGSCGKINPVTQIFMMKNIGGYKDQTEIVAIPGQAMEARLTPEEIAKKIEADIPVDDMPEAEIVSGGK